MSEKPVPLDCMHGVQPVYRSAMFFLAIVSESYYKSLDSIASDCEIVYYVTKGLSNGELMISINQSPSLGLTPYISRLHSITILC